MKTDFYSVGERFSYDGTTYRIRAITDKAIEISSTAEQSLWVNLEDFHKSLGLKNKSALFDWYNKYLIKE